MSEPEDDNVDSWAVFALWMFAVILLSIAGATMVVGLPWTAAVAAGASAYVVYEIVSH